MFCFLMEHKYKTMLNNYSIEIDIRHKNNLICKHHNECNKQDVR